MTLTQIRFSAVTLKRLVVLLMVFDHFAAVFTSHDVAGGLLLRMPGRVVAPVMCYLIAEGYFRTSNLKKYLLRLFVFAVLSHIPYILYFGLGFWQGTSVMWALFLGLAALAVCRNERIPYPIKLLAVGFCCFLAIPANWNYIAVLWIVFFGLYRGNLQAQITAFLGIGLFLCVIPAVSGGDWAHLYQLAILLAVPLMLLYSGCRGKTSKLSKWGFYVFYPAHLLLLCAVKVIFLG